MVTPGGKRSSIRAATQRCIDGRRTSAAASRHSPTSTTPSSIALHAKLRTHGAMAGRTNHETSDSATSKFGGVPDVGRSVLRRGDARAAVVEQIANNQGAA